MCGGGGRVRESSPKSAEMVALATAYEDRACGGRACGPGERCVIRVAYWVTWRVVAAGLLHEWTCW